LVIVEDDEQSEQPGAISASFEPSGTNLFVAQKGVLQSRALHPSEMSPSTPSQSQQIPAFTVSVVDHSQHNILKPIQHDQQSTATPTKKVENSKKPPEHKSKTRIAEDLDDFDPLPTWMRRLNPHLRPQWVAIASVVLMSLAVVATIIVYVVELARGDDPFS
jgi:hypothetical protein